MIAPDSFAFTRTPEIRFGPGRLAELPQWILRHGRRVLLVTGSSSFARSEACAQLKSALAQNGLDCAQVALVGEPSPEFVDRTVARYRHDGIDCVLGIGGGSVLDAGKAISAMLPQNAPVGDFLEGRATREHDGRKRPYIAVPTTSGTGSEATKNAVLSEIGVQGFKNSLRHDNFVPDLALLDPELMLSCPAAVTAACALDALTQLLEAYVSTKASPLTDALALRGLAHFAAGFPRVFEPAQDELAARGHLACAALLSGIVLANAGLGVVHGLAGPLGGFFAIPHGVVCGTLLGAATRLAIEALASDPEAHRGALEKYARAGFILAGQSPETARDGCRWLVRTLDIWIGQTRIPRLGDYGLSRADFAKVLDKAGSKNSPWLFSREEMASLLAERL